MSDPIDEAIHQAATGYAYKDGWNAAIKAAARVAEHRKWGVHTPLEEIAAAIRALGKP